MKVKDVACTDNPMDGHDKFCPIWIVGDRIMTECECELINKVQADCEQRVLDAVEAAIAAVSTEVTTHGVDWRERGGKDTKQAALSAIRKLRKEK